MGQKCVKLKKLPDILAEEAQSIWNDGKADTLCGREVTESTEATEAMEEIVSTEVKALTEVMVLMEVTGSREVTGSM